MEAGDFIGELARPEVPEAQGAIKVAADNHGGVHRGAHTVDGGVADVRVQAVTPGQVPHLLTHMKVSSVQSYWDIIK